MPSLSDPDHLSPGAFRSFKLIEGMDFALKEMPPQAPLAAKSENLISGLGKYRDAVGPKRNLGKLFHERNWIGHSDPQAGESDPLRKSATDAAKFKRLTMLFPAGEYL